MGQLNAPSAAWSRARLPWRRSRRRHWARANDLAGLTTMFAAIPSLPRAELARLTTHMIDRMDEIDGDSELELNGDEFDCSGSLEEDAPDRAYQHSDGLPGDPDDAEDGHDHEQEETYG